MTIRDIGLAKEKEAEQTFTEMFDTVQKSKHQDCYDFLSEIANEKIYIEVKWRKMTHKSTLFGIQTKQFNKLIALPKVLFYFMTSKGNIFASMDEVNKKAHLHHNKLNPTDERIVVRVAFRNRKVVLEEPDECQFCRGLLK